VTEPDLLRLFVEPLEELGFPYMITGAVAAVVYGEPRFTRDVDVVLELPREEADRLAVAFGDGDYYVPPLEVIEEEVTRGGHFNVIHRETALKADLYLVGRDPFHRWALDRRQRIQTESIAIWVAPIEYVIVRKLAYHRFSGSDRHLRDVAAMLRISGDRIDQPALERWVTAMELTETLKAARMMRD
jgi:hypothetical protein